MWVIKWITRMKATIPITIGIILMFAVSMSSGAVDCVAKPWHQHCQGMEGNGQDSSQTTAEPPIPPTTQNIYISSNKPTTLDAELTTHEPTTPALEAESTTHESTTALNADSTTALDETTTTYETTATTVFYAESTTHESTTIALDAESTTHESTTPALEKESTTHESTTTSLKVESTTHRSTTTSFDTESTTYKSTTLALDKESTTHESTKTSLKVESTTHKSTTTALDTDYSTHESTTASLHAASTSHESATGLLPNYELDINKTLKEIKALDTETQVMRLEQLAENIISKVTADEAYTNDENKTMNHLKEFEDVVSLVNKIAVHVPEGKRINIVEPGSGIVASVQSVPDYLIEQETYLNISLPATKTEKHDQYGSVPSIILPIRSIDKEKVPKVAMIVTAISSDKYQGEDIEMEPLINNDGRNDIKTHEEANHIWKIASGLLSIQVLIDGFEESFAPEFRLPVKKNPHFTNQIKEAICVFWEPEQQDFSERGVTTGEVRDGYVSCHSNHTTSFAVLMQITEVEISDTNLYILEMLTFVLTPLSIIGLSMTVLILLGFESLRKSERNTIHINLAASLLVAQFLFLVAVDKTNSKIACNIIAMILHYLFLSAFGWMLVEGINLYYKIVKVFGADASKMRYYFAIGWGLPVPIVIVSTGIRFNNYASKESCWLSRQDGLIWAFAAPVALVNVVNTLLLIKVGYILYTCVNAMKEVNNTAGIRTSIRGTLLLTPILGLTWMFGFVAVGKATVTFQYLFVIGNCLQGVFIFAIFCLFNQEVRAAIKITIKRYRLANLNLNTVAPLDMTQVAENKSTLSNTTEASFVSEAETVSSMSPGGTNVAEQINTTMLSSRQITVSHR